MSGQEQKSPKLRSDLKRSQSTPRKWPTTVPIIEKRRGRVSTSAERIRVTQGTIGMAGGSEHDNANEFLNNTGNERKTTLAMSTHPTETPTVLEMPKTSFAAQNASAPTAETEPGWTYFGAVRNPNVSPMLSSNTNGSDSAAIADSDLPAIADSDATVTFASEVAAVTDDAEASRASKTAETNSEEQIVDESMYECNICLDIPTDAVVSLCGHLFCWLCLNQWLQTRPNCQLCPVCKSATGKDKVIPLYGRDGSKQEDPRNKVPPRAAGQRQPYEGFGFGGGFHMPFGILDYTFGRFAPLLNFGEPRAVAANHGTPEQLLSKLFVCLAFLCIVWFYCFD